MRDGEIETLACLRLPVLSTSLPKQQEGVRESGAVLIQNYLSVGVCTCIDEITALYM